ncbi:MAG: cbb3-type cytochrome c oxidase subunit I [Rhodanobacter sp.]
MAEALPLPEPDTSPLSPWWIRSILIVLVLGLATLCGMTAMGYRNAPPIPGKIVDAQGQTLFTGADISAGQGVFLKYGLMDNGSIWGHGAYIGPDYSAEALHHMGLETANALAQQQYGQPTAQLDVQQQAGIHGQVAVLLKTNRYDAASDTLQLTTAETLSWNRQIAHWTDYFKHPDTDGGLKPHLISDPTELRQFTAFVTWAAWASVANRPGFAYSYTNNFPYEPLVGNTAIPGAYLWSALSLLVLLAGIAAVLLIFGRYDNLGWISHGHTLPPRILPGQASAGQRALVKFFVVVALLFLFQTLVGAALGHYRAEPSGFYGIPLEDIFPSNLMRTWHLQSAIFWIATAYVAAALFLGRTLRRQDDEPHGLATWTHLLFGAFVAVIGLSMLGEWAGMSQLLGKWWFWFGDQGWEYLEIGRFWQYLLVLGLFVWFALLYWIARPSKVANPNARPIARMFLWASLAIPVFYTPALFYGAATNLTVVETWRFWIIHLWTEGFFEFFATTVVALILYQLGLAHRNVALRVIYLDGILVFLGGIIGTGHHWYFEGHNTFNMAMSGMFSVLEVVPLTLLTLDAWGFVKATEGKVTIDGVERRMPHKWTFHFLMAVGFWNFVGAGMFGFLINLPIVSYYETGTVLTPNHAHTALMGVFGMLGLALMVFVLRQTSTDENWPGIEKYVKVAFWGTNVGLAMMVVFSLFPNGVLQLLDVIENGYWHARSFDYLNMERTRVLEWMRMPGDLVFIVFGSVPLVIATFKGWLGMRASAR